MNINGLKVNTDAIGEGLYRIICQQGQEAIVAFGMLPADIMESLDKMLREKILAESAKQIGCSVREMKLIYDERKMQDTVRPIVREVSTAIFRAASHAGKMVV